MTDRHPDRWGTRSIPERVLHRVLTNVTLDPSGCWISNYSVASHGYAQIGWQQDGGRYMTTAHRAAWTAVHGSIPVGMTVDHICRVKRCVNPDHLRLLSNVENGTDNGKQRVWEVVEGRVCAYGHPLVKKANGWVFCRECANAHRRQAHAMRRAAVRAAKAP